MKGDIAHGVVTWLLTFAHFSVCVIVSPRSEPTRMAVVLAVQVAQTSGVMFTTCRCPVLAMVTKYSLCVDQ